MKTQNKVYVALPAMDEFSVIRKTLDCIRKQTYSNYHLYVCVNQPEIYHHAPAYSHIVEGNRKTLELLNSIEDITVTVIDRSSPGKGWDEKNYGVGWARKVLIDEILEIATDHDIVVSMDADTKFHEGYFQSIVGNFHRFPASVALSNPYYHPLTSDRELNMLMLRYEIYMRYYVLNLWRISSPYSFTALGSAISFPVVAYRRISGVAPKFSGEDFYMLQKLRKSGRVLHANEENVYPATRYSNRVFFGTGPALIKGRSGDWSSYPFYGPELFDRIALLYEQFNLLYEKNIETAADEFLKEAFGKEPSGIWDELRQNNPDQTRFIHACHVKFDGLRILQFLRFYYFRQADRDIKANFLFDYLTKYHYDLNINFDSFRQLDFLKTSVKTLNELRDVFFQIENGYRKRDEGENEAKPPQKNPSRWKYLGS
jgi:glycosyltransferase involved in cell wall biosynthesis